MALSCFTKRKPSYMVYLSCCCMAWRQCNHPTLWSWQNLQGKRTLSYWRIFEVQLLSNRLQNYIIDFILISDKSGFQNARGYFGQFRTSKPTHFWSRTKTNPSSYGKRLLSSIFALRCVLRSHFTQQIMKHTNYHGRYWLDNVDVIVCDHWNNAS